MLRPQVPAKDIPDLICRIDNGLADGKRLRHLGAPGSRRKHGADRQETDELHHKKCPDGRRPGLRISAPLHGQRQKQQGEKNHIPLMDKAHAEIQGTAYVKQALSAFFIQIPVQAPENPYGHPERHGFHQSQNLADLIIGHPCNQVHGAAHKAHRLGSGQTSSHKIDGPGHHGID